MPELRWKTVCDEHGYIHTHSKIRSVLRCTGEAVLSSGEQVICDNPIHGLRPQNLTYPDTHADAYTKEK